MKRIIFIVAVLFVSLSNAYSQDTLIGKTIRTKEFDLRTYGIKQNLIYKECNNITPASDTSFFAGEKLNSKLILYKDIRRIDIQSDNRRTWEGVWKGGLTGGLAGIMAMTFFNKTFFPTSKIEGGGGVFLAMLYETVFIASGSLIGGIIGSMSFYSDYYDLTKFKPEQRKQKALSIFLKYSLNL
ncbi:MAG: hypothetical protein HY959_00455 [Ignavibacteriae bacterium]|nr:hypothetical protein [Ignavibacteriota bacterium]